jgi:hypothetical protein
MKGPSWTISCDEKYLLDEVMDKCTKAPLGIKDPAILELKESFIRLKKGIMEEDESKHLPGTLDWTAYRYYQHINLATLFRLWQSSVSVSSLFWIIASKSEERKAQKLSHEFFSFTISAFSCFSLFFEEFRCLNALKPRNEYYFKTNPDLYNKKVLPKVRCLLCLGIKQSMPELDELHTVRNKITHLFPLGSGLYFSTKNDQWLMPKPEPEPRKFIQYYQEMVESDNRDKWFEQNSSKSSSVKDWSRKILQWLAATISKGWKHLSQKPREQYNI